jgi:hypothetical protein
VRALDVDGRWLQACCHAVLGGGSGLRALRDVAQIALIGGADWRGVVDRCVTDGVDVVPAEAVREAWWQLRLDPRHPLAAWATAHVAPARQAAALASYRTDTGWGSEARSMLGALGVLDRVLFLGGLALPSRASRRHRRRSLAAHLRRGSAALRRSLDQ